MAKQKQDEPSSRKFNNEVQTYKQGQKIKHNMVNLW